MTHAKEIVIRAGKFSDGLTRAASQMILDNFGGFFAVNGVGGFVEPNGESIIQDSISWHIGTIAKDSTRFEFLSSFAREYCRAGNQDSVYMRDIDGVSYLAFSDGKIRAIA